MTELFEKGQTELEQKKNEALTKIKEYGLCKACKDRVNCFKICEPKIVEFQEKFLKCTDEFGNTEMYKMTFTQEDKFELDETLDYRSVSEIVTPK